MEQFVMERITFITTLACTLNCKLCVLDAPYRKTEYNFNLEEQKAVIERYFEVVSYVKTFSVSGGEPLLNPKLPALLRTLKQHMGQIGRVEVITNGTICPSEELLETCQLFEGNISFLVDDYGDKLSTKTDEIRSVLKKANIFCSVRPYRINDSHCGGWVDYGDPRRHKRASKEAAEKLFSKCAQAQKLKFCFDTFNGVMYPCEAVRRCIWFNVMPEAHNECVNLLDPVLTVEELREKIRNIYETKSLCACAFCKGMCDDSERFMPAEQLTAEEIECVRKGARFSHEVDEMMCKQN